ncbi:hypothetical protein [Micromonospora zhanjiangensis]|uniref:CBM-cenC domain-containing protein n=1 Tax=Micromonospora zhanjiangensis TaxID=1522057 RepID=A0ABV8KNV1_9ACTN
MGYDVQFVDSISATATVRLDLGLSPWNVRDNTVFDLPDLRRSAVSTLLADGDRYPAAAYANRVITLVVQIRAASDDATAAALQTLMRELDRQSNIMRYRPGTSAPVFFRTFRTAPSSMIWDPVQKELVAQIPAEPFALGVLETLPAVRVANDPALANQVDNANPYFETDASNWSGVNGASVARTTILSWEGLGALTITPAASAGPGAQSEELPATAGNSYWLSGRLRSWSAATRTINLAWYNSSHSLISTSAISLAAPTDTWVGYGPTKFTAPAGAAFRRITTTDPGTPGAGNPWYVDSIMTWADGAGTGCCWDVAGVKGDVETPLNLAIAQGSLTGGSDPRRSVIAVRRRGTPAQMPLVLQAETMTGLTDTAIAAAAGDPNMSGGGQNFLRTTFATNANLVNRARLAAWPSGTTPDTRGTYRVFARVRKSNGSDVINVQALVSTPTTPATTDTVTLPQGFANVPVWADLGLLPVPAGADPVTDSTGVELAVAPQTLLLLASRSSGSGTLDWDVVLFVPADDRLAVVDWPVDTALTSIVLDSARVMAYGVGAAGEVRTTGKVPIMGGLPMVSPGVTNRIVWLQDAGTRASGATPTLGNSTVITASYHPRYLYVRPATT